MPASISIANQVVIWPLAAGAQHGVQLAAIQGVAPSFGVELRPLVVRDAGEIEPAISAFARGSNGGLIVTIGTLAQAQRDLIITLAGPASAFLGLPLAHVRPPPTDLRNDRV